MIAPPAHVTKLKIKMKQFTKLKVSAIALFQLFLTSCQHGSETRNTINNAPTTLYSYYDHSPKALSCDYILNESSCFIVEYAITYVDVKWYYIENIDKEVFESFEFIKHYKHDKEATESYRFGREIHKQDTKCESFSWNASDVRLAQHFEFVRKRLVKSKYKVRSLPAWLKNADFVDHRFGLEEKFLRKK